MKIDGKKQKERRSIPRINISYYVPVVNAEQYETLGILSDISTKGLLVNSQKNLSVDQQVKLRLDLSEDCFDHPFINFSAQVKSVRSDPYGPGYFNIGFEMIDLSIANFRIIEKIMEKYAA